MLNIARREAGALEPAPPEGLTRSTVERQADLERAFSAAGAGEEERERITAGLNLSRRGFLKLYRERWGEAGMPKKLEQVVNGAFEERMEALMPGTAAIQMAADESIIGNIQDTINFKFSPTQEAFLGEIEAEFGARLRKEIRDFFEEMSALLLATTRNPMARASIRDAHGRLVKEGGAAMMGAIQAGLRDRYPDLLREAGSGSAKAAAGLGLLLAYYLKKSLAAAAARSVGKKVARHSLGKIIGMGIPLIGWGMMAWSVYDFYSLSREAKEEARQQINQANQALYYEQVPEVYWDKMEPFVLDSYIAALGRVKEMGERAERLAGDPRIVALSGGLSDIARMVFAERMAGVASVLGEEGYDEALSDFGPLIRDASPENFERFVGMLEWNSLPRLKAWFDAAGEEGAFDIFAAFPQDRLANFPPGEESLRALKWMARNLTPGARKVACELPDADLRWVMDELPARFVPRLFADASDAAALHAEIARLSQIPGREAREPWQGAWAYWWSRHGTWVLLCLGGLLALVLIPPFLALARGRRRRKADAPPPPVVITQPIVWDRETLNRAIEEMRRS